MIRPHASGVRCRVSRVRPGYLLAEALVMLVLAVVIGAAMCAALISQAKLARTIAERVAQNDAARTAMHILPVELRTLDPVRDIRAYARDSIAARLIRGSGVICDAAAGSLWLRVRGMRMLDPSKDSLLVTGATGEYALGAGDAVRDPAGCPAAAGEEVYRVATDDPAVAGVALLFESGTYYLSQRALRYRLGAEGRQPLTEELLRDAGSGMGVTAGSATAPAMLRLTLELIPGLQRRAGRFESASVPFANGRLPL